MIKRLKGYNNIFIEDNGNVYSWSLKKPIKPILKDDGYLYVINKRLDYLVATTFIGNRPFNHRLIHINGNKLDNNVINLRYANLALMSNYYL